MDLSHERSTAEITGWHTHENGKIKSRRMKMAGHCIRHPELSATHSFYGNPHKLNLTEV